MIGQVGALVVLLCACIAAFPSRGFRATEGTLPVGMSRFLVERAPKGNLYNDYEYSAALEWFLDEKRPLYIDLINAYPPELFDEWFEISHATPVGLKALNARQIEVIALRPLNVTNEDDTIYNLFHYLQKSRDWKLIYERKDGRVWARRRVLEKP